MSVSEPASSPHAPAISAALSDVVNRPLLSVVVPTYKSAACIRELARRLQLSLAEICENYEIMFVEDAGGDESWDIIRDLAAHDLRIRGLQFCRNFGQHFALTAGIDYARGDWIVIMDCDLQDPPESIKALYAKAQEGFDVVLARRIDRGNEGANRLTSRLFYRVFDYMTGTKSDPLVGAFRLFSKRVRDAFTEMREQERFFGGLMQWMGFLTATVDVPRAPRYSGESTYTFGKRLALAFPAIVAFSNKPLLLAINLGFLMSFLSFFTGVYFIFQKIVYDTTVEGWTSVIVSLYFIGGIIMMTLGVVGMYVGKTFDQTKGRPLYIIQQKTFDA